MKDRQFTGSTRYIRNQMDVSDIKRGDHLGNQWNE